MPVRCNALVALRDGDLIAAIGLAATFMLERRLRIMRERSPGAPTRGVFGRRVIGLSRGVMLSSRSIGSTGLGSVCEHFVGVEGLVIQGARRPDEKRAEYVVIEVGDQVELCTTQVETNVRKPKRMANVGIEPKTFAYQSYDQPVIGKQGRSQDQGISTTL